MAEKINFTQQRIDKLPTPEIGRVDYYDTGCPKLTCRVSSTGVKSFVLLKWNGKTAQRVTLGRFPDLSVYQARQKATEALFRLHPVSILPKKSVNNVIATSLAGVI